MTRKRFVKSLMSKGYQRNEANELATENCVYYGSYQTAYDRISKADVDVISRIQMLCENCHNTIIRCYNAVEVVAEACRVAVKTIEKQIPRKPLCEEDSIMYKCPCCKSPTKIEPYCLSCGQKLDWSAK